MNNIQKHSDPPPSYMNPLVACERQVSVHCAAPSSGPMGSDVVFSCFAVLVKALHGVAWSGGGDKQA